MKNFCSSCPKCLKELPIFQPEKLSSSKTKDLEKSLAYSWKWSSTFYSLSFIIQKCPTFESILLCNVKVSAFDLSSLPTSLNYHNVQQFFYFVALWLFHMGEKSWINHDVEYLQCLKLEYLTWSLYLTSCYHNSKGKNSNPQDLDGIGTKIIKYLYSCGSWEHEPSPWDWTIRCFNF